MGDWVKDNKGVGAWDFTEQPDKPIYNEGTRIATADNPVWVIPGTGTQVTDSHNPGCGYWTKEYTPAVPTPIVLGGDIGICGILFDPDFNENFFVGLMDGDEFIWGNKYVTATAFPAGECLSVDKISGGLLVAGRITPSFAGIGCVMKLDITDGSIIWQTTFSEAFADEFVLQARELSDGSIMLAHVVYDSPVYKPTITKLSSTGAVLWSKKLNTGAFQGRANDLVPTGDGGAVVVMTTADGAVVNASDIIIAKLTSSGSLSWLKRITSPSTDYNNFFSHIIPTADGGYVAAGRTGPSSLGALWIVKLTSTGEVTWDTQIPASGLFGAREQNMVAQVSDGYLISGYNPETRTLTKLNLSGAWQWSKKLGSFEDQDIFVEGLALDGDAVVIGGLAFNTVTSIYDIVVSKSDLSGDIPGCSFITSEVPTVNAGDFEAASDPFTFVDSGLTTTSITITPVDSPFDSNRYCSSGELFATQYAMTAGEKQFDIKQITFLEE
jgi:hypothetical protein